MGSPPILESTNFLPLGEDPNKCEEIDSNEYKEVQVSP
jgi:hypothetical protein